MAEPFLEINLPGIPAHRLLLIPGGEFRMAVPMTIKMPKTMKNPPTASG